ncbi:MFS transporter [Dechloromonas sp. TW-R-39-2]|uniref:MFS transporter n=1 Tax=Dechloromonas sp. TW-R-39-2 TaxID=2654218 RepID=UPI00193E3347|nr:MFS transporter [Dechloromonas sp. TW-R-39-2]QRM19243.1 MFS transporter [Dechloromonas sp. TW-R-39-2]
MTRPTLTELFAQRQFMFFWLARLAGVLAQQMLMVALAWQMYDITGSAWDLGLVGLFQFVPALLLTLPAGHLVDRWRRGRIFAACMLAQASVALLLVGGTQGGFLSRELILLLSVVLGAARAFQMPTQQALIPMLVPVHLLERAVTLGSTGMQAAVICGPALGGLLYVGGATVVYAASAGLLMLAFSLMFGVHEAHQPSTEPPGLRSILAGVEFVWNHKLLLGATSLDLFAVLLGGATALLPIFARDILHVGPEGLGLLRAAPAVGALLMSLALLRWPIQRRVGRWLFGSVGIFGLATVVFGLSNSFWLSLGALVLSGAADNISVVMRLTLVQLETPNEIRGRVSAVNSIFIGASNQLGEFESGATAALFGAVGSVVFGGVGTLLVAAGWIRLFPELAGRDRMVAGRSA